MANFFIDRPIFASGVSNPVVPDRSPAIFSLPVEQYPDLAPPNVRVTANYPARPHKPRKYRHPGYRAEHDRSR